ncbi:prepilin peptidase [Candidatus Berkelbacteria bacterium]|nr:prepilin peptidase [Candidatus Berkelbacteria bacterium]
MFVVGLALGSTINVIVSRFGDLRSFINGRSVCDHCGKRLAPWQIIPIIGFLLQRGRCRFCNKAIPWRYSVVELVMGLVAVVLYQGLTLEYLLSILFFSVFMVISLIDIDTLTIPDPLLALSAAIAAGTIVVAGSDPPAIVFGVLAGLAIPALFVLPTKAKVMGIGDIKLGGVMGLMLGFPLVGLAFWVAFVAGGLVSLILIGTGQNKLKDQVAFGPFLAFGTFIAYRFGSELLHYVTF